MKVKNERHSGCDVVFVGHSPGASFTMVCRITRWICDC